MFELSLCLTALVLASATFIGYRRTRDVLHPMVFLAPLFAYSTVIDPWLVRNQLDPFFGSKERVTSFVVLNLLAVCALAIGTLHATAARLRVLSSPRVEVLLSRTERDGLRRLAIILGLWALGAYAIGIANVGGFAEAFSESKGGGRAGSGYIQESMNLGLVSAMMAFLGRFRKGFTPLAVSLAAIGLLPNFIQGTFGGRRGPLLLCFTALIVGWVITRRRQPRLWFIGAALAVALAAVVFVWSQRRHLYLGTVAPEIRWDEFLTTLTQRDVSEGNNFIYGAAFVLTTQSVGEFTWGRELAVNLFVRPVPRQLWPTKYEDVGATWITHQYPGLGHFSFQDWLDAVGWIPFAGSSAPSISDLFGEFGWGAVVVMYAIGRGYAFLRVRRLRHGGLWELLYLEALMLSIYLATQSFSAFYHRFLVLAVPTALGWRVFVRSRARTRRGVRLGSTGSSLLTARPMAR